MYSAFDATQPVRKINNLEIKIIKHLHQVYDYCIRIYLSNSMLKFYANYCFEKNPV